MSLSQEAELERTVQMIGYGLGLSVPERQALKAAILKAVPSGRPMWDITEGFRIGLPSGYTMERISSLLELSPSTLPMRLVFQMREAVR